jgi:hypothetical protein
MIPVKSKYIDWDMYLLMLHRRWSEIMHIFFIFYV